MKSLYLLLLFVSTCSFICNGGNKLSAPAQTHNQMVPFNQVSARDYLDYLITTENYNQRTVDLATPLMLAAEFGLTDRAKTLLINGSEVDALHPEYSVTALAIASTNGYEDIVSLLMFSAKDRISAIVGAAKSGHISILKLFFPHTSVSSFISLVDINSNEGNDTALTAAARAGQRSAIDFLLDHGADINCATPDNFTPLGCALLGEHQDVAQFLIDKGGSTPDISWCLSEQSGLKIELQEQGQPVRYLFKKSSLVQNLINCYRDKHYKIKLSLSAKKDNWLFYRQGEILIGEQGDFVIVACG